MNDSRRELVIDGNLFSNMDEFYDEIDCVLTKGLDWKTGHNLNAFNDLLRGGFGVHDYEEPIVLVWKNSHKSRHDLNRIPQGDDGERQTIFEILVEIIREHGHIELRLA